MLFVRYKKEGNRREKNLKNNTKQNKKTKNSRILFFFIYSSHNKLN